MENILKKIQKQNDRPLEEQDFPSDKKKKKKGGFQELTQML